jgi:hypothetical protein
LKILKQDNEIFYFIDGVHPLHNAISSYGWIEKLRKEKFVLDWRKKLETRASVKITIEDFLFTELPKSYNNVLWKEKSDEVYFHVYDNYVGEGKSVYC